MLNSWNISQPADMPRPRFIFTLAAVLHSQIKSVVYVLDYFTNLIADLETSSTQRQTYCQMGSLKCFKDTLLSSELFPHAWLLLTNSTAAADTLTLQTFGGLLLKKVYLQ